MLIESDDGVKTDQFRRFKKTDSSCNPGSVHRSKLYAFEIPRKGRKVSEENGEEEFPHFPSIFKVLGFHEFQADHCGSLLSIRSRAEIGQASAVWRFDARSSGEGALPDAGAPSIRSITSFRFHLRSLEPATGGEATCFVSLL